MKVTKEKTALHKIIKFGIYAIVIVCALLSLFWQKQLGEVFKFRPNINYTAPSVHFVYVSKGDCILIRTSSGENIIIDSADACAKDEVISYIDNIFFRSNKKEFDYAILTHPDDDHLGNFNEIVNRYKIKSFYRPDIYVANMENAENNEYTDSYEYKLLISSLNAKNIDTHFHSELPCINFANGYMRWFTPSVNSYAPNNINNYSAVNDYSPIIIYRDGNCSYFFSGDASINVENEFIDLNNYNDGAIDVLKMGHHGSATSTSLQLLNYLQPSYLISSNGDNFYDFPASKVIDTVVEYDRVNNTSLLDNIIATSDRGNIICYNFVSPQLVYIDSLSDYFFVDFVVVDIVFIIVFSVVYLIPYRKIAQSIRKKYFAKSMY